MVGVVQDTHPEDGYNADGNILFYKGKLWIIWKENNTNNTKAESGYRLIMGCSYDGKSFSRPQVFAHNPDNLSMYLAAPILHIIDDKITMLGVYSPIIGDNCPGVENKPIGIVVFGVNDNCLGDTTFYLESIKQQSYRKGFDFWQIDCFTNNNIHYCLVTPERGQELFLGESQDGLTYTFYDMPLLHENGRQRIPYMYKPSGVLIGNRFHLLYPSRVSLDKVHIFCTSTYFDKLISKLKS